jgi:antitoxin HicB
MLIYPARVTKCDDGYVVTFRDIPEANTSGKSLEEAMEMAGDALSTAMEFYFEDERAVPLPSATKRGEVLVDFPASLSAKVLLLNEMVRSSTTPAQLARKLHTSPQAVNRIVDIHHVTKIDTIAEALNPMGKKLLHSVA